MKISTSEFGNFERIPEEFTCDGIDISPALNISGVPEGAKSLALIVEDPDAPSGNFVHWTMWNINPGTMNIKKNNVPEKSVQGSNDAGKKGYHGPCPPKNSSHKYIFKAYALNKELDLFEGATATDLKNEIEDSLIEKTELIGVYGR